MFTLISISPVWTLVNPHSLFCIPLCGYQLLFSISYCFSCFNSGGVSAVVPTLSIYYYAVIALPLPVKVMHFCNSFYCGKADASLSISHPSNIPCFLSDYPSAKRIAGISCGQYYGQVANLSIKLLFASVSLKVSLVKYYLLDI